jgi:NTP pyrophosphatase (non-canonical NTP hydrolase)
MNAPENETDFSKAMARSMQIRQIYHELEKRKHGTAWTPQEDMIGFTCDVGELGRMLMAAEGRWVYPGDLKQDLGHKLSECLWWLLALSGRLGVDINAAFAAKMSDLESSLSASVEGGTEP